MPTHYDGTVREQRALDVFIKLLRAADSVARRSWAPLANCEVTPTQFGAMETLYHLGPLTPSQLAAKHLMSRNNFTVVIDNLEKQGYVTRERNTEDRRSVTVHLTPTGEEIIKKLLPIHAATVADDIAVLEPEEQLELGRLLRKLGKR